MKTHDLMRGAALKAGFAIRDHDLGFTGVLSAGPGAPLLLVCWNTGEFDIRGEDICSSLRCGRGYAVMIKALRAAQARARHFGTVSAALADGFVIDGGDGLAAYVDAAEAERSGVSLRAGDRLEFSIRLGGAAFDVMLAADSRESDGRPQVDDRHLLDGIAGCVAWSAAAA